MELWGTKLIAFFVLFAVLAVAGVIPVAVSSSFKSKRAKGVLKVINCFGAGVLFAFYLLFLDPSVRKLLEDTNSSVSGANIPFRELAVAGGFFLLLFIDKIAAAIAKKVNKGSKYAQSGRDDEVVTRPYVLLCALSVNAVFEGMRVGQHSNTGQIWMLLIGIGVKQLIISFIFGLRLIRVFDAKKSYIFMIIYALAAPIGIMIGLALFRTLGNDPILDSLSGFAQAVAEGVFMYITFLEIFSEEEGIEEELAKPLAMLLGFLFMAAVVSAENNGAFDVLSSGSGGDDNSTGLDCLGSNRIDLVFVVDSSGSICDLETVSTCDNWEFIRSFIVSIIENLSIGEDETRVGLVRYSTVASTIFYLHDLYDHQALINAVASLQYAQGATDTAGGLREMHQNQFTPENGDRPDVPNTAILITDGEAASRALAVSEAEAAKNDDIRIIVFGVTDGVDEEELRLISSEPQLLGESYFLAADFNDYSRFTQSITESICLK